MKYTHYIYIANSYRYGDRIAYDLVVPVEEMNKDFDNVEKMDKVQNFLVKLYDIVGEDTLLTNHVLITDSEKWESVVAKDTFFNGIKLIKNQDNFIEYLAYNKVLTRYDVMSLLIVLIASNDLQSVDKEKLIDSIYKKYQQIYNRKLFEDAKNDRRKLLGNDTIKKCSNIILDRVIASENGFEKFNFILQEVRSRLGKPLFVG